MVNARNRSPTPRGHSYSWATHCRARLDLEIVPLTHADFDEVDLVLRSAYKRDRPHHSQLMLHLFLQPEGTLVAKADGRTVGFGAITDFGSFSYVGLMATRPDLQGKGIGRRVLERLVNWADSRGCPAILLDATPFGAPLYLESGFSDVDTTIVFRMEEPQQTRKGPSKIKQLQESDLPRVASFDSPAFGANRDRLLRYYWKDVPDRFMVSHDSKGNVDGYLVAQDLALGPWVVLDDGVAENLLLGGLQLPFELTPQVFVSGSNARALNLLGRFGFREQRRLRHMIRGTMVKRARTTRIYGQASLGFG